MRRGIIQLDGLELSHWQIRIKYGQGEGLDGENEKAVLALFFLFFVLLAKAALHGFLLNAYRVVIHQIKQRM